MNFQREPLKLHDCQHHGRHSRAELFIVEGDSAARAVVAVRDPQFQAVLPMQGKPINAMKARAEEVAGYELYNAISNAIGGTSIAPENCRYEKVVLLLDPDADGIHCGALILMYFYQQFLSLLDAGCISMVHAPLVRLTWRQPETAASQEAFCYSMEQARQKSSELESQGATDIRKSRYRGLASLEHESLLRACVAPQTRRINRLQRQDAEAAIAVFGG